MEPRTQKPIDDRQWVTYTHTHITRSTSDLAHSRQTPNEQRKHRQRTLHFFHANCNVYDWLEHVLLVYNMQTGSILSSCEPRKHCRRLHMHRHTLEECGPQQDWVTCFTHNWVAFLLIIRWHFTFDNNEITLGTSTTRTAFKLTSFGSCHICPKYLALGSRLNC